MKLKLVTTFLKRAFVVVIIELISCLRTQIHFRDNAFLTYRSFARSHSFTVESFYTQTNMLIIKMSSIKVRILGRFKFLASRFLVQDKWPNERALLKHSVPYPLIFPQCIIILKFICLRPLLYQKKLKRLETFFLPVVLTRSVKEALILTDNGFKSLRVFILTN